MNIKFHKIKQYNIFRLLYMTIFRIVRRFLCYHEELFVIPKGLKQRSLTFHNISPTSLDYYFSQCKLTEDKLARANDEYNGYINLFGHRFNFDYKTDWLRDPITGSFWDKDTIWYKCTNRNTSCDDIKYVLEINKMGHLVDFAIAYRISGETKYIERIYEELKSWMDCVPFERSVANWIVMDWAFRAINLVHISFLCADNEVYNSKLHPIICVLLSNHARFIYKFCTSRWYKSENNNNHDIGELVGVYAAWLWLENYTSIKIYDRQKQNVLDHLKYVLDKTIDESGVYLEHSSSYSRLVAEFLIFFETIDNTFNHTHHLTEWFYKKQYTYRLISYLKSLEYNGLIPNFGDNDSAELLIPFNSKFCGIDHIIRYGEGAIVYKHKCKDQFIYKSKDGNVFTFIRYGTFAIYREGAFVHSHCDLLSPIISLKGEEFIIDKGCSYYNKGLETRREYSQNYAHNCIAIDGYDMASPMVVGYKNYPKCKMTYQQVQENSFLVKGELKYGNIKNGRIFSFSNNQIVIEDDIYIDNNDSNDGYIQYYISPQFSIQKHGGHIECTSQNTKNTYIIKIKGVELVDIQECEYYIGYANPRKTKRIVGQFNIKGNIKLKTTIEFK